MVVALLLRRAKLVALGEPDPYPVAVTSMGGGASTPIATTANNALNHNVIDPWEVDSDKMAVLRLVYVLERGLQSKMSPHSAIEWALARSSLIDRLKSAILGNYQVIMALASVLEDGGRDKKLLDLIINRCMLICGLFHLSIDSSWCIYRRRHGEPARGDSDAPRPTYGQQ